MSKLTPERIEYIRARHAVLNHHSFASHDWLEWAIQELLGHIDATAKEQA